MPHFNFSRPSPDTTHSISRGLSAFFGGFTLLNLLGEAVKRHFAGNLWWIDLRPLPIPLSRAILFIGAIFLVTFAIRPAITSWRRCCTAGAAGLLGLFALWNSVGFFALLAHGEIHGGFPVPLSLFIVAALGLVFRGALRPNPPAVGLSNPSRAPTASQGASALIAAVAMSCCIGFPLAQMVCFGHTDYRRRADVIVVFGARVYADGTASQALADRVRTACELYHQGLADKIVFSGGPGDGSVHETETMRRLALQWGVADSAIYCDRQGLNTEVTVRNTGRLFRRLGVRRVLAVSHAYHLPRVKMAYLRGGWDVYTVPARETRMLRRMPLLTAREVAALWAYYLRPFRETSPALAVEETVSS